MPYRWLESTMYESINTSPVVKPRILAAADIRSLLYWALLGISRSATPSVTFIRTCRDGWPDLETMAVGLSSGLSDARYTAVAEFFVFGWVFAPTGTNSGFWT